jgi:hypothetical protein
MHNGFCTGHIHCRTPWRFALRWRLVGKAMAKNDI